MQIIYGIYNHIEDLWYIGSSIQGRTKRKSEHFSKLKCGNHENDLLQNAATKYGIDSFEFFILEEIEQDTSDYLKLSRLEEYYIKEFNSYYKGYNRTDNVVGSSMQSDSVRSQHWGELHGSSTYSNTRVEEAFLLLANTTYTSTKISSITSIPIDTISYIKSGGHEWVHKKYPKESLLINSRISIRDNLGTKYSNDLVIKTFECLLNNPKATFKDISSISNLPIETISAISTGRQYKNLLVDTYGQAAKEYFMLGRLNYTNKYSPPNNIYQIITICKYLIESGYASRDIISSKTDIPVSIVRNVLELESSYWNSIVRWSGLSKEDLLKIVNILSNRSRVSESLKLQSVVIINMINNV